MGGGSFTYHVLSAQKSTPQAALAFVKSAQAAAAAAKEYAAELQKGLSMFGIAAPPHADLDQTVAVSAMPLCNMQLLLSCGSITHPCIRTHGQDLALLGRLWAAALEWDELYAGWKDCAFAALDVGVMQSAAARIGCTLQNLAQDIQTWPAFEWIQAWAHAPARAHVPRLHLTLLCARAA